MQESEDVPAGAAAGPSGVTADHLRVLLYCPMATTAFIEIARTSARADVLEEILGIGLGRMTTLRKPSGWRRCAKAGGSDHGTSILRAFRGGHVSMPVRAVDPSRHGMRHTHPPVSDRLNIAYDLTSCPGGPSCQVCDTCREVKSFCLLSPHFTATHPRMCGRTKSELSTTSSRRRRRAGRRPDADVVQRCGAPA